MRQTLAKRSRRRPAGGWAARLVISGWPWVVSGVWVVLAAGSLPAATLDTAPVSSDTPPEPETRAPAPAPAIRSAPDQAGKNNLARRKAYLEELRRILPKSEPWEAWLRASEELPPDFEELKREPFLPDPLRFENGKGVTLSTWTQRRRELWAIFQHYLTGTMPASPGNVEALQVQEREEAAALVRQVILAFGPKKAARLYLELIFPEGEGPFPVFLTTLDHRPWALVAVSRGYVACLYAGGETQDQTGAWTSIWPEFSWSQLLRRAWAAGRCVDYLHHVPGVDTNRLAIAGHGPGGKVALIAGALDLRINAVVASSSGAGGACSFRFFSEAQFGEGIEPLTREHPHWFHPRLRFFAGRESRLPVDQPQLMACIAPRPCLLSTGLRDPGESAWAVEQSVHSARRVYDLFQRGGALTLHYRPGGYTTRAEDAETFLDWLDTVFDRGFFPFPDAAFYPTYDTWEKLAPGKPDPQSFPTNTLSDLLTLSDGQAVASPAQWAQHRQNIRDKIFAALGVSPSFATTKPRVVLTNTPARTRFAGRDALPAGLAEKNINFGNDIAGDLCFPSGAEQARHTFPAAIWLHPVSPASGYVPPWRQGDPPHLALARLGFVALAYDQIGHGTRLEEVKYFYHRYPGWSLLGKQIDDALAAVDALLQIDFVDPGRIYLVGYQLGGTIALHAAALDSRVAGVVSLAGFTPMRSDPAGRPTGSLARWSRWFPLHPQFGAFLGAENRLPYDYHQVLALIAPRPALLFVPHLDEESNLDDINESVRVANQVSQFLGGTNHLQVQLLDDYNRFSPESQRLLSERLAEIAQARLPGSAEPK